LLKEQELYFLIIRRRVRVLSKAPSGSKGQLGIFSRVNNFLTGQELYGSIVRR